MQKEQKGNETWKRLAFKRRQTSIKSGFFHWQLEKNQKAPIGIERERERERETSHEIRTAKRNGKFHQELSSLKVKFPTLLNAS